MGQVIFQPKPLNIMKSFIEKEPLKKEIHLKEPFEKISEKLFIDKPFKDKELFEDIFEKYSPKEKLTIKERPSVLLNELNTFFEKRFKSAPVPAPAPAHVPGNSSDYAAQLSDAEAAFLQSHGVKKPAAGIAKYEPPKPATRAGI